MQWKILIFNVIAWTCGLCIAKRQINYENFLSSPNVTEFTHDVIDLIRRLRMEAKFEGYYFYRNRLTDCVDEQLPTHFRLPMLQYDKYKPTYVRGAGNSMILAIICLRKLTSRNFLIKFANDMQYMRNQRVVVIHNQDLAMSTQRDLTTFFETFMEFKFLNVVLIHRDFNTTNIYHTFNQFPEFVVEMRDIHASKFIFPYRLRNVNGKKLRTLADQIEPHTLVYKDEEGDVKIGGYIGKFIITFARKYNFTLPLPDHYNSSEVRVVTSADIRMAALNDTIDVGISLLTPQKETSLHRYTYPIESYKLLTMLPVEPTLETYKFFLTFFRPSGLLLLFVLIWHLCFVGALQMQLGRRAKLSKFVLIWLLLVPWNMDMLRPLFTQSTTIRGKFFSRRMIYILSFLLGGIVNNFFSTNLAKWLTVPPHEEPIQRFREVGPRNLKIQVAAEDVSVVRLFRGEKFWQKHIQIFKVMNTFDEYQDNIRKMDSRYAYVITTIVWPIVERRQKYFAKSLFRLSESLYYTKGSLLSLPVNENTIYRDILNHFCIRAREAGLLQHWYEDTFFRMVKLKRINLKDLSKPRRYQLLTLKEFKSIWTAYCIGMGLSMLALILEIAYRYNLWGRVKSCLRKHLD